MKGSTANARKRQKYDRLTNGRTDERKDGQTDKVTSMPPISIGGRQNITQNNFCRHDSTNLYISQSYDQWLDLSGRILDHLGSLSNLIQKTKEKYA